MSIAANTETETEDSDDAREFNLVLVGFVSWGTSKEGETLQTP